MNKKLLAVAMGAAFAAPMLAQADVTVYGIAQVEWANATNDGIYNFGSWTAGTGVGSWNNPVVAAGTARSGLLDNKMGRFGIKASEDLGGGWSGIAQFEFQTDTADNQDGGSATTPITSRSSFVGIAHKSIGNLRVGRDATPYAVSGTALDPFVATSLEARNNLGMSGNRDGWGVMNAHGSFVSDSLFFNSASWAGAYVNLSLGLDHTGTAPTCVTGNTWGNCDSGADGVQNAGSISAVAGWKGDLGPVGLNVFGGYNLMTRTANVDDPTAMKVGAQLTFAKAHTVSLQYENTDRGTGNDLDTATYIFVGYQGKFGPVTAVAQLGTWETGEQTGTGVNIEGTYYALGAIYNMSKTFRIYGGYRATVFTVSNAVVDSRDDNVFAVGMRKDF